MIRKDKSIMKCVAIDTAIQTVLNTNTKQSIGEIAVIYIDWLKRTDAKDDQTLINKQAALKRAVYSLQLNEQNIEIKDGILTKIKPELVIDDVLILADNFFYFINN